MSKLLLSCLLLLVGFGLSMGNLLDNPNVGLLFVDFFKEVIGAGDMVPRKKPAPDIYLHAARAMGHAPARCAVVEDTPTGVKAGIAAGMSVFGYVGGPQSEAASLRTLGATPFARMAQLPRLLGVA